MGAVFLWGVVNKTSGGGGGFLAVAGPRGRASNVPIVGIPLVVVTHMCIMI